MFSRILVANRGEIACRIIRTARRMGITAVAVYSDADAQALHVRMADEAWYLGPAPAVQSYLDAARILQVCREAKVDAVHPGYGFLSENADFAESVTRAGLIFVGPPASAMRAMGSKSSARRLMELAGVPLVPGYHGSVQDDDRLVEEAGRLGFPVLVKASAGGGGKGMRVVHDPLELPGALASARREARSAFGDDQLLLEKYLDHPRHVEMQIFADTHGHCVHLFERDCSLQRRHQKVIEEAPAPGLSDTVRQQLGEAATAAARSVDYVGAGTVEFLFQDETFYFIEMNTRLQVEHPVTEMITGEDLVEWQFRVAAGEPLPRDQEELSVSGHAFEARICAEDPGRDFLPSTGRLVRLRLPPDSPSLRLETGVVEGDVITVDYDPMLAKLVVHGPSRAVALRCLNEALQKCQIAGIANNVAFLAALSAHPDFVHGPVFTSFIDRQRDSLVTVDSGVDNTVLAFALLDILLEQQEKARQQALGPGSDPGSPWHRADGWRLNGEGAHTFSLRSGHLVYSVMVRYRHDSSWKLELPDGTMINARAVRDEDGILVADLDGVRRRAVVLHDAGQILVLAGGRQHVLRREACGLQVVEDHGPSGSLVAPMPGKVVQVMVRQGDRVTRGQVLMILEAMKMEHTVKAPSDGTVGAVVYGPGDQVSDGARLLHLEREGSSV